MEVQTAIERQLQTLKPQHLVVENESHRHNVPPGSESHFKVTIVTEKFHGLRQVQRHQAVYQALAEQLAGPVHALALHTYSPEEWEENQSVRPSPDCMGGGR